MTQYTHNFDANPQSVPDFFPYLVIAMTLTAQNLSTH